MLNGEKSYLVNIILDDISTSFEESSPGSPFLSLLRKKIKPKHNISIAFISKYIDIARNCDNIVSR